MSTMRYDHGGLPARAQPFLTCPNLRHGPPSPVVVVPGSGYRAKFKCGRCGLEFTISDAQLRQKVAP
jgi:hypothetical protein